MIATFNSLSKELSWNVCIILTKARKNEVTEMLQNAYNNSNQTRKIRAMLKSNAWRA